MINQAQSENKAHAKFISWANQQLQSLMGIENPVLSPLAGDAGFRRYFKVDCGGASPCAVLAVNSPPATENNHAFVRIATALREQGVQVPKVLAHELENGYLLVESFGEKQLLDELDEMSADIYYGEALTTLLRIQSCSHDYSIFPRYDDTKLAEEFNLFEDWFASRYLGIALNDLDKKVLLQLFDILRSAMLSQPQSVVHRDFHARNLMVCDNGSLGVIDFQDAVIGPVTYDLVSILKDCYIQWPRDRVKNWCVAYGALAAESGVIADDLNPVNSSDAQAQWLRWFDYSGLHRHIKVLGIFCRLSMRDGKHGYLHDLPRVFDYVMRTIKDYDELAFFEAWMQSKICGAWEAKQK